MKDRRRDVPKLPAGIRGLKRHPSLVALSRDHHAGLVEARALRLAAGGDARAARATAAGFLGFHARELVGHFADEERVLLPRCRETDAGGCDRILAEHQELAALVEALRASLAGGGDPRPLMGEAAQLLDDHIRFEERGFFEGIQKALPEGALEELGRAIDAGRTARGAAPGCPLPASVRTVKNKP